MTFNISEILLFMSGLSVLGRVVICDEVEFGRARDVVGTSNGVVGQGVGLVFEGKELACQPLIQPDRQISKASIRLVTANTCA